MSSFTNMRMVYCIERYRSWDHVHFNLRMLGQFAHFFMLRMPALLLCSIRLFH